jgi:hypothetical protein
MKERDRSDTLSEENDISELFEQNTEAQKELTVYTKI